MKNDSEDDNGHIEIELKGPKGKRNLVIRRNINRKSKGSTFSLNGNSASGREITQNMAELNVQVGNLWYVCALHPVLHLPDDFDIARSYLKTRYRSLPR